MCNENSKEAIEFITRQFLCAVPLKELQWGSLLKDISWDEQGQLIQDTVLFKPNLDRPVKLSYQKAFVKTIIAELELNEIEVHDVVFEAYGQLVSQSDLPYCYRHFVGDAGQVLSFKENVQVISNGTTGLCCWEAGLALTEWCMENKHQLEGKTVLELGSGVGFTGISTAVFCHPSKIYLTDCHEAVLENLCENVRLNVNLCSPPCSINKTSNESLLQGSIINTTTTVEVVNLNWAQTTLELAERLCPEVVLAADVVYDNSVFEMLTKTFTLFLKKPGSTVMLACTERNEKTLNEFLNLLGLQDFFS